jgi:hypothetical protein
MTIEIDNLHTETRDLEEVIDSPTILPTPKEEAGLDYSTGLFLRGGDRSYSWSCPLQGAHTN